MEGTDVRALGALCGLVAGTVVGLVRRVVRGPAQSGQVAQEVLIDIWRSAARFGARRGSALGRIMTLAQRRAVDRVRSAQAAADRERRAGLGKYTAPLDEASEQVERRLEREQVRRCLEQLTELKRESVTLAYYRGYTYRETVDLLGAALGTVKTRLRDRLIRLPDCLAVAA
ncbi:sigma-70 family RNA polymerase sigma factor [Streptomyces sp. NPDC058000]|uniref:sigma-70 family RNA polymerase sigma factor n=1 Tax=Streptomyces sp. NPDC058000 TaxID=3346299 RepID=UPI0036E0F011